MEARIIDTLIDISNKLGGLESKVSDISKTRDEDMAGLIDQVKGALKTITNLELDIVKMQAELQALRQERSQAWEHHSKDCKNCHEKILKTVKDDIDEWHKQPSNMSVIQFFRNYWWQVLIIGIVASAFLQFDESIVRIFVKLISR